MSWCLPAPDAILGDPAYQSALARIFAYSEAPRSPEQLALGRARKLDRMRALLGLAGAPQARFPTVLVAGTKGKGSMVAALTAMLSAAGYRVGRYTQPHLYSYRERIWADGDFITPAELIAALDVMSPALEIVSRRSHEVGPLTTFDVGTALALVHFARVQVDVAVVEVGVGGASDATNVLEPLVSVIGPVGLDHRATLGPDLASIAREKAGVARSGADVVVGRQELEALRAIEAEVGRIGGHTVVFGRDFRAYPDSSSAGSFAIEGRFGKIPALATPLRGAFQRENAVTAVAAALALTRVGWRIPEEAIRAGLAGVHWPGRFQTVLDDPLTVVDGAHNASAARALASAVADYLSDRPLTLVLGMAEDKDVTTFMAELAPSVDRVIVTRARHPRSTEPTVLAAKLGEFGFVADIIPRPSDALRRAWERTPAAGAVLVTGSLFLVGDIMEWLLGQADRVPELVR